MPFLDLPYQAEVALVGPQNIQEGLIRLNKRKIHFGYIAYNSQYLRTMCQEENLNEAVTEIDIDYIKCSSAQVLNSLIEQLGQLVDEDKGLRKIKISGLSDKNNLEEWPLDQLVTKCFALESININ